ncbi:hypothetical protein WMW72_12110 [Paenibacillus filicis]|uniref:Fibronectin type-III domain-containing protein n=1 Tax=Paenibacillus filicis TaxID=669464 RepID=A0ABU9DIH9_9BACL
MSDYLDSRFAKSGAAIKSNGQVVNTANLQEGILHALGGGDPVGSETLVVAANKPSKLASIPAGATQAVISVEGGDIRYWRKDDPPPSATSGHPVKAGAEFTLDSAAQLAGFRAYPVSGSPVLQVSYLGAVPKPPEDTQPPTTPTGLTSTSVTASQVQLSWSASTDNVGVVAYDIYRGGTKIGSSSTTTYTDNTVSPGTSYSYTVKARDAAGNVSAASSPVSVSTPAAPDTQAPSIPTGLTATAAGTDTINLAWTASTDNVGVAGYDIYRDGNKVGSFATTTYSDTGLTASTTYSYTVKAKDAAGNISAASAAASATTQAAGFGAISDPEGRSLVADRGYTLNSLSDPGSPTIWGIADTFRTKHTAWKNFNGLQLIYPGVNGELATPNPVTYKIAIEFEDPTTKVLTRVPIAWDEQGTRSKTVQPSEVAYTYPLAREITKGTNFWIRTFVSVPAGGKYPKGGPALFRTLEEGKVIGQDLCDFDQTTNPILAVSSDVAGAVFPLAIIGKEKTGERTASVLLYGDSIQAGSADNPGPNGEIPSQRGFGVRACFDAGLPWSNVAIGGERVQDFRNSNTVRLHIAPFCTHAIGNYGTNDNGSSLSSMKTYLSQAFQAVKAKNPKIMLYQTKILGRNTGNINTIYSAWYTPGNVRDQVNDWISTAPYADGLIDGYFDGAYGTETQNPRTGGFRSTAYTADWTHPLPFGHDMIRRAVDTDRMAQFKSFAKVEDRIPSTPTSLKAFLSDKDAMLVWDKVTDFFVSYYNVYRNGVKVNSAPIDYKNPVFYESGLTAGTSYTYSVKAVSIFDVEGAGVSATKQAVNSSPIVSDSFNRADSTNTGDVEVGIEGSKTWQRTNADRYDINGNMLRRTGTSGIGQYITVQTGVKDQIVDVKQTAVGANQGATLVFRFAGNTNLISVSFAQRAGVSIRVNNVLTSNIKESLPLSPAIAAGQTSAYRVAIIGNGVFIFLDGVNVLAAYDERLSFATSGTMAGMGTSVVGDLYDDYSVRG